MIATKSEEPDSGKRQETSEKGPTLQQERSRNRFRPFVSVHSSDPERTWALDNQYEEYRTLEIRCKMEEITGEKTPGLKEQLNEAKEKFNQMKALLEENEEAYREKYQKPLSKEQLDKLKQSPNKSNKQ